MGTRSNPTSGMVIFDERFINKENLAANTATALTSDYNQAGAKPGLVTAVSGQKLVPRVHNAQTAELDLKVTKGGFADRASFAYSIDAGTTYRGWNPPYSVNRWEPIVWSDSTSYPNIGITVLEDSQKAVCIYNSTSSSTVRCKIWDGSSWGSAITVASGLSYNVDCLDIVRVTDDLLLAVILLGTAYSLEVYRSTDGGATWTFHSEDTTSLPNSMDRISCAFFNDQILMIAEDSLTDDIYHYVSNDLGHTFEYRYEYETGAIDVTLGVIPDIGFVLGYTDTNVPYIRVLSNADVNLGEFQAIQVDAGTYTDMAVTVDYNRSIYVLCRTADNYYIFESKDVGETWEASRTWFDSGDVSTYPTNIRAACVRGNLLVIGNHNASPGNEDGSISLWCLSAFENLEVGSGVTHTWQAIEVPSDMGWTANGATAGTIASDGFLEIATSASSGSYTYTGASTANLVSVRFSCQVDSGGSTGGNAISPALEVGDGTASYKVILRLSTTGFALYDSNAASNVGTGTVDMTSEMEFFISFKATGRVYAYYKRPWEHDWTAIDENHACTSGAPITNWTFIIGNGTGTATSRWRYATLWQNLSGSIRVDSDDFNGVRLTSDPYPIPGLSSGSFGFISVAGGYPLSGQTYEVNPKYTYAIDNLFAGVHPSPSVKWRSSDTTEQILTYDLGASEWLGGGLGLLILGANFRTAYLEVYSSGSWITVGTWDGASGFTSLTYARTGTAVSPGTSTTEGDRFIKENELKGAWIDLGSSKYRRIAWNSAGVWADDSTTVQPNISLVEVDGTEGTSGTCNIIWPDGLLVAYPTSHGKFRYWRVRIPTQGAPESYFEAGIIALGRVAAFGQSHSWGWSQEKRPNYRASRNDFGTERRTKLGPNQRVWSIDWSDGVSVRQLRQNSSPDYVGVSGGVPLGAREDVWWLLEGLLESTEGASVPVCAVNALPSSSGMITDLSAYLYGYISSSVQFSNAAGEEGVDEVGRIERITIEGVV